jgi:glycosyltransferase involved in cell wall biosynthesis
LQMQAESLITVLVPVHEYSGEFLLAALDSLRLQTAPTWRALVIVEPAGRTAIESVLAPQLTDSRIRVIENEGRKLAGAFNTGMRHSDTIFVAILLADDLWTQEAVAVLEREICARPEVDFFHSARRVIDGDGRSISSVYPARPDVTLADFETFSPVKHLLCWRRTKGLDVGGMDESLNSVGPDDLDFPWIMAEHGATFGAVDECLYVYRDHRAHFRLTTHLPMSVHRQELNRIYRKHGLPRKLAKKRIRAATTSHLRQCLYRSTLDKRVKEVFGHEPKRLWRENYH